MRYYKDFDPIVAQESSQLPDDTVGIFDDDDKNMRCKQVTTSGFIPFCVVQNANKTLLQLLLLLDCFSVNKTGQIQKQYTYISKIIIQIYGILFPKCFLLTAIFETECFFNLFLEVSQI